VVGCELSAATVFSGEAFTVGVLERTAFGPAAFFKTLAGAGALCSPISVRAKFFPACCDARFRSDVEAACRSRLRSSAIVLFGDAPFLPHAASTIADKPAASIEDLMTFRTCASKARAYPRVR